jgi:uncharacterized membrane protein YkoI
MRPPTAPSLCLLLALATSLAQGEDERVIALKDAPAAVREAVSRQFPGSTITSIEVEVRDGRTVYEAETTSNGTTTMIKLDEHGKLLKTRIKKAAADDDAGH